MKTTKSCGLSIGVHALFYIIALVALPAAAEEGNTAYSPPVANDYPNRVFWGDTHVHSNQSPDAFTFGNQTVTPEIAYRFARGETVTAQSGIKARLSKPLDFLMVSDHAEFMGIFPKVFSNSPDITDTPLGKRWTGYVNEGEPEKVLMEFGILSMGTEGQPESVTGWAAENNVDLENLRKPEETAIPDEVEQSIWSQVGKVADQFNEPGRFTAFIGYEWTSMPNGNNLHRNVLFRDNSSKTTQVLPFSSIDSGDPEKLWQYMESYENETGGKVLAIPHNGNLSNGLMFAETTLAGKPINEKYAQRRSRWEPIIEVTQIKGDGETHSFLSPNDEFADYETWDKANISFNEKKTKSMLEFEYARSALKNGLALQKKLGANPYKFGMLGSTDSHTGLATADEDNYFGKMSSAEPAGDRSHKSFFPTGTEDMLFTQLQWESAASGYAAVWARENTREALFDAMQRKEVYATTGPRMTVRFFGGWEFEKGDTERPDLAVYGYKRGVPMGGDLQKSVSRTGPSFILAAQKDPLGANLERLQIVKGWLDANGKTQERVFNVAASDNRKIENNNVKSIGSTVNVKEATYRNSVGAAQLSVVWRDPDFNPKQHAFYYARVLEIPTPRWTTIDEHVFGKLAPKQAPKETRERAYTSPIWYSPE